MNMYFMPEYHFSKEVSRLTKIKMINDYNQLRGEAVELLNPMYKEWNEEYTDPVNGDDDPKYNRFIYEKHKPILDSINRHNRRSTIDLETDLNDCADIIARNRKDRNLVMRMTLKPM